MIDVQVESLSLFPGVSVSCWVSHMNTEGHHDVGSPVHGLCSEKGSERSHLPYLAFKFFVLHFQENLIFTAH